MSRRRALLMGGKGKLPLVLEIDTTKTGVTPSNGFQIPANATGETYLYRVDWGDGTKTERHTGVSSHTYLTGGVYQVKIYGKFPRMYFNNGGDRQKLIKVLDWGEINYGTSQTGAFYGCENLTEIAEAENGWYNNITNGTDAFRGCKLTSLPVGMTLANLTNGSSMFRDNNLTALPDEMTLSSLTYGFQMFNGSSLTALPDGMTLASLDTGNLMFYGNSLTSLPDGMTLTSLTSGSQMFMNNSLTSLPDGMTLANLTNGFSMFFGNSLTALPIGMTLANLTSGNAMFSGNSLTSLPDGMTLANLTNGNNMFVNNSLTSLPIGMTLASLTNGNNMFMNNNLTNVDNLTLTSCTNLTNFVIGNPNFNGQINVGTQVLTSISGLGWGNKWSQDMSAWVFSPDCSFGTPTFNPSLSNSIEFTNEHWGKLLIRVNDLCGAGSGRTAEKVLGVRNTVKYPASAAAARQALIDDGWEIRDGGAE